MEQNGPALVAVLTPDGWNTLVNSNNWSQSYSNYQWTIKANPWAGGWFIPFAPDMNFTITCG